MTKFVGPEIIVWQIGRPWWELINCLATTWRPSPLRSCGYRALRAKPDELLMTKWVYWHGKLTLRRFYVEGFMMKERFSSSEVWKIYFY